jgi:hypothetical protein
MAAQALGRLLHASSGVHTHFERGAQAVFVPHGRENLDEAAGCLVGLVALGAADPERVELRVGEAAERRLLDDVARVRRGARQRHDGNRRSAGCGGLVVAARATQRTAVEQALVLRLAGLPLFVVVALVAEQRTL